MEVSMYGQAACVYVICVVKAEKSTYILARHFILDNHTHLQKVCIRAKRNPKEAPTAEEEVARGEIKYSLVLPSSF